MDPHRKRWNQQQQKLQRALLRPAGHQQALDLFLSQHALVHSARLARTGLGSFEDEVWQDMPAGDLRRIPRAGEHSIAWIIWHMARIEDVTMNVLVAGRPQLALREGWLERMQVTRRDTGNLMDRAGVADLSAAIDLDALRAYRLAVGRATRRIVKRLGPDDLRRKVEPARLQALLAQGAVVEAARGRLEYWGRRTIAGLLLMPPTRHNLLHLNEALRVRQKLARETHG
jgi:hypothetical protein